MTQPTERTGALRLSFGEIGEVAQAIAAVLVERGYTTEQIVARLKDVDNFDEPLWWEVQGNNIVADFADFIDLTEFPEEEA